MIVDLNAAEWPSGTILVLDGDVDLAPRTGNRAASFEWRHWRVLLSEEAQESFGTWNSPMRSVLQIQGCEQKCLLHGQVHVQCKQ